jgi:hypothetical protein
MPSSQLFEIERSWVRKGKTHGVMFLAFAFFLIALPWIVSDLPGWGSGLSIVLGLLVLWLASAILRMGFRPKRYAVELSDQGVSLPHSGARASWSLLSALRNRALLGRIDILDQPGSRFASLEYQLDSFQEALDRVYSSLQLEPTARLAFRRRLGWRLPLLLASILGCIAAFHLGESEQGVSAAVLFLFLLWVELVTAVRSLSFGPFGIETREGLRTYRIPWFLVEDVRWRLGNDSLADIVVTDNEGDDRSILPRGVDALEVYTCARKHLADWRAAAAAPAPSEGEEEEEEEWQPISRAFYLQYLPWVSGSLLLLAGATLLLVLGRMPVRAAAVLLLTFCAIRIAWLIREAVGSARFTPSEFEQVASDIAPEYDEWTSEWRAQEYWALGYEAERPSSATLARGLLSRHSARSRSVLAAECLGLLGFVVLLPASVVLYTRDLVPLRGSLGWLDLCAVTAGLALYAWPLRSLEDGGARLRWLWVGGFVSFLLLCSLGVSLRHPYLDPTREDRPKLAADKILSLNDNVRANVYADWVFDYAMQLEEQGDYDGARFYYDEGLRIDPSNERMQERLLALKEGPSRLEELRAERGAADRRARAPLWTQGRVAPSLQPCTIDRSLEQIDRTTVVIASVGDVPDQFVDVIAEVIANELDLRSCAADQIVPLPPATRVRGVFGGRQWSTASIAKAFVDQFSPMPRAAAQYLVLTAVDTYVDDSNYIYSVSYRWGAVVSFARFGDREKEGLDVMQRAAKQSLGALTKSFGVRQSTDPNCVTSYVNGFQQFEAKGNRPTTETLALLQEVIRERDRQWTDYTAARSRRPQTPRSHRGAPRWD